MYQDSSFTVKYMGLNVKKNKKQQTRILVVKAHCVKVVTTKGQRHPCLEIRYCIGDMPTHFDYTCSIGCKEHSKVTSWILYFTC